jgi:hypothetical protein
MDGGSPPQLSMRRSTGTLDLHPISHGQRLVRGYCARANPLSHRAPLMPKSYDSKKYGLKWVRRGLVFLIHKPYNSRYTASVIHNNALYSYKAIQSPCRKLIQGGRVWEKSASRPTSQLRWSRRSAPRRRSSFGHSAIKSTIYLASVSRQRSCRVPHSQFLVARAKQLQVPDFD